MPSSAIELANYHLNLLESQNPEDQLKALRLIKNQIIGNPTNKAIYTNLNVIERILLTLKPSNTSNPTIQVQTAVVLGSLAYGSKDIVSQLLNSGATSILLECINLKKLPYPLVEASARALKSIFSCPESPRGEIFKENHLNSLLYLLAPPDINLQTNPDHLSNINLAQLAALILGKCADTQQRQNKLIDFGVLPDIMGLLTSGIEKAQEAALETLSALCSGNESAGHAILNFNYDNQPIIEYMAELVKSPNVNMQLLSCNCITNLNQVNAILEANLNVLPVVLSTLVKLLESTGSPQIQAPLILAGLVNKSQIMQKAACDSDAIKKLSEIISQTPASTISDERDMSPEESLQDTLIENCLLAIASICSQSEDCRKQVIEAKALPFIVSSMSHYRVGVRAAACECTKSLSRSVKTLRTSLVEVGVTPPLFKLLEDSDDQVRISASATLCNLVLDFSPIKKVVLESGGITSMVSLIDSENAELRYNAVFGLKNLLFQADSHIKSMVMDQLGWQKIMGLLVDPNTRIQEQALAFLRNLSCGKEADIDLVFKGIGEGELLQLIFQQLKTPHTESIIQALYVIVNIATGNTKHKSLVMASPELLNRIHDLMNYPHPQVRVATAWCIINLTWIEDNQTSCFIRIKDLRALGFEDTLKRLVNDDNLDVKDRARTALQHFQSESRYESSKDNYVEENRVIRRYVTREDSEERSPTSNFDMDLIPDPSL